jgi:hypothetical protein
MLACPLLYRSEAHPSLYSDVLFPKTQNAREAAGQQQNPTPTRKGLTVVTGATATHRERDPALNRYAGNREDLVRAPRLDCELGRGPCRDFRFDHRRKPGVVFAEDGQHGRVRDDILLSDDLLQLIDQSG